MYRYIDFDKEKGVAVDPRWLSKRTEGQMFVVKAANPNPDGPVS